MLTRQRHVIPFVHRVGDEVFFQQTPDQDPYPRRKFWMSSFDWEDMGKPPVITVTVEPGDLLNPED